MSVQLLTLRMLGCYRPVHSPEGESASDAWPPRGLLCQDGERDSQACVQVDSKMQTSLPDVYAVGDIAAFPLPR